MCDGLSDFSLKKKGTFLLTLVCFDLIFVLYHHFSRPTKPVVLTTGVPGPVLSGTVSQKVGRSLLNRDMYNYNSVIIFFIILNLCELNTLKNTVK